MRENNLNDNKIKPICLRFQTVAGDMFVAIITYISPFYLLLLICLFHTFTLLDRGKHSLCLHSVLLSSFG